VYNVLAVLVVVVVLAETNGEAVLLLVLRVQGYGALLGAATAASCSVVVDDGFFCLLQRCRCRIPV
jgi:hypothetical protein